MATVVVTIVTVHRCAPCPTGAAGCILAVTARRSVLLGSGLEGSSAAAPRLMSPSLTFRAHAWNASASDRSRAGRAAARGPTVSSSLARASHSNCRHMCSRRMKADLALRSPPARGRCTRRTRRARRTSAGAPMLVAARSRVAISGELPERQQETRLHLVSRNHMVPPLVLSLRTTSAARRHRRPRRE
eukprot:SAG22_NODE_169_length_16721_cov_6.494104_6_plen_188_part_00